VDDNYFPLKIGIAIWGVAGSLISIAIMQNKTENRNRINIYGAWVSFSEFSEYSSLLQLEVICRRMDAGKIRTILFTEHSIRSKAPFTSSEY